MKLVKWVREQIELILSTLSIYKIHFCAIMFLGMVKQVSNYNEFKFRTSIPEGRLKIRLIKWQNWSGNSLP